MVMYAEFVEIGLACWGFGCRSDAHLPQTPLLSDHCVLFSSPILRPWLFLMPEVMPILGVEPGFKPSVLG